MIRTASRTQVGAPDTISKIGQCGEVTVRSHFQNLSARPLGPRYPLDRVDEPFEVHLQVVAAGQVQAAQAAPEGFRAKAVCGQR